MTLAKEAEVVVEMMKQARTRVREEFKEAFDCQLAHALAAKYLVEARVLISEPAQSAPEKQLEKARTVLAEGAAELKKLAPDKKYLDYEKLSGKLLENVGE